MITAPEKLLSCFLLRDPVRKVEPDWLTILGTGLKTIKTSGSTRHLVKRGRGTSHSDREAFLV